MEISRSSSIVFKCDMGNISIFIELEFEDDVLHVITIDVTGGYYKDMKGITCWARYEEPGKCMDYALSLAQEILNEAKIYAIEVSYSEEQHFSDE